MYKRVGIEKIIWIAISLFLIIISIPTIIEYMQLDEVLRGTRAAEILFPNIEIIFIMLGISIISLILAIRFSIKEYTMPLEDAKTKAITAMKFMCQLLHRVGIDGFPSGQQVVILGYINKLEVCYSKNKKEQKLNIDTKDIVNISTFYEWQEKGNTQIKNAIIGGIIAGGAGAIVGSNLKNVKNKEYKFLAIKYLDENRNEKILVFNGLNMSDTPINFFINEYKKHVPDASDIITVIE